MTTYLGKSCSFCLPRVPFVNCRQFVYLVISLLVLRAGYGIWLYQFLIIAYLFTFQTDLFHLKFMISGIKRDDFDFDIVNFPFLDGDVPRSTSRGVNISQHIQFARVSSQVADFNARNKSLTAKLLQQGHRYHKLRKTFSNFYRRHYEFVSKFNVGLKTLLHLGLSEPEFYGDLVYKFKKIVGRDDFSDQFKNTIICILSYHTYWIYHKYNATFCMLSA